MGLGDEYLEDLIYRLQEKVKVLRDELVKTADWLYAQESVAAVEIARRIRKTLWDTATQEERHCGSANDGCIEPTNCSCRCAKCEGHSP